MWRNVSVFGESPAVYHTIFKHIKICLFLFYIELHAMTNRLKNTSQQHADCINYDAAVDR